jgi:putative tryptophan/tyrosine transport system substrate-binding protein
MRSRILCTATAIFIISAALVGSALAADKIAVLVSSKDATFEEALKGFQVRLDKAAMQADYEVHRLDGSVAKAGQAVQAVKTSGARLVLTLGSLATDAAVKEISDIPIVACMVLRADGLKKSPNVTGVGLEFSLQVQTSWLQVLLPKAKTVGVLYNPDENKMRIEAAGRIVQNMGLKLVAQEVRSPHDVPAALEGLAKKVDVLWGMADTVAMTPHSHLGQGRRALRPRMGLYRCRGAGGGHGCEGAERRAAECDPDSLAAQGLLRPEPQDRATDEYHLFGPARPRRTAYLYR